ncbi:MAG: DUF2905 domain-containing protein [Fimbriimonadaceae bacterium]|nr:DUF2905 domain-containing protein [Fimbriimonadaceae bacterium]
MEQLGRLLLGVGIVTAVIGAGLWALGQLPMFRGGRGLPGDISVQRDGFSFQFPIVTCIVLSALLSLIFWLISAWRR